MKKGPLVLAICVLVALVITGCSTGSGTPTTAAPAAASASPVTKPSTPAVSKTGGTLRWLEAIGPSTPIGLPAECNGPSGLTPQISLETLLKEQLGGAVKPGLAASYDVSTNPPSITFHLQKGVKFSDGTDFNAAACKWNLDQIKASTLYASTTANWKSIEVVDDSTIRVSFNNWQNTIIPDFCGQMTNQISPTAYNKNGADYMRWHLVGTGPLIQTDFQKDVSLTAVRNPNYWQPGKPYLDGFKYFFIGDPMTREALFKSGGAEVIQTNGNGPMANRLKDAGFNIVTQLNGPTVLVMDNANADSPFSNLKVRQAVEYALDKESMATTLGVGWWQAVYQFSNPASISFDSTIAPRKFDPAKAKQLLTEAGYPNGFKTSLVANPLGLNKDLVLSVQDQLGRIGIQAEALFPDTSKWTSDYSTGTWKNGILVTSIFDRGNQNLTFNYFLGIPATTWKSVAKPDGWKETLEASKATPDQDAALLKKLEKMVDDNVLCIPVVAGNNVWAMAKNVQDTGEGTRGQSSWINPENAWLSK